MSPEEANEIINSFMKTTKSIPEPTNIRPTPTHSCDICGTTHHYNTGMQWDISYKDKNYLSLDALVPVWEKLRKKCHSLELTLNEKIGRFSYSFNRGIDGQINGRNILYEIDEYHSHIGNKDSLTIQQAAAIVTAKAIKELGSETN